MDRSTFKGNGGETAARSIAHVKSRGLRFNRADEFATSSLPVKPVERITPHIMRWAAS